jgi:hypothetical protein
MQFQTYLKLLKILKTGIGKNGFLKHTKVDEEVEVTE